MNTLWGTFALVSYLPQALSLSITHLRHIIPGNDQSQPHITLLPPRPLRISMDEASDVAFRILDKFRAFDVELATVQAFPATNVIYLDVLRGGSTIRSLHEELNQDVLADDEVFPFLPHLTLGGPVDEGALPLVQQAASDAWAAVELPKHFNLHEVVALWAKPTTSELPTLQRVWTYKLQVASIQRGARV